MNGSLCELFQWLDERYEMKKDRRCQQYLAELHDQWHECCEEIDKMTEQQKIDHCNDTETRLFTLLKESVKQVQDA